MEKHYKFFLGTDKPRSLNRRVWWKVFSGVRIKVRWPDEVKKSRS